MVEWKKLGEVEDSGILTLGRGQVISKIDMNDCPGDFPVYSSSSQNNGEIGRYGKYMFDDERITWSIDGGGKLFYRNGLKYSVTNVCGWLKVNDGNKLNTKFLYYLLFEEWTNIIFDYNHKAHPSVIRNEYQIPIIPLEEQTRIVGILDTFTASIDNLKQQIAERRKQYNWFLDKVFYSNKYNMIEASERGEIEVKTLEEIGTFIRGRRFVRTDIVPEGVPCIHYGDMYTYYGIWADKTPTHLTKEKAEKLRFAQKGDVVIVAAGENDIDIGVGVAWLSDEDVVVHDACFIFKHEQNPRYLSYYLRSNNYHQQIRMGVVDGKICSISAKELGRTLIAIPALEEQSRIVSILDTFEASIQNLEAQLKEREKQYEFYRNKLLTFE